MDALRRLRSWAGTKAAPLALRLMKGRPVILMYHGVTARPAPAIGEPSNLRRVHLPLDLFADHMRLLHRRRRVIGLSEMVDALVSRRPLHDCVALTFDDGYRNNHDVVAPVLADMKLPASFFLTTGLVDGGGWMWSDRLGWILGTARRDSIHCPLLGRNLPLHGADARRRAFAELISALRRRPPQVRDAQVSELAQHLDVTDAAPEGDYRFMTWDQARALAAAGFDVGAHTVHHPMLAEIGDDEARAEILGSRDRVRAEVGRCCDVFCYPFGKSGDYRASTREFCRAHFRAALSTERGPADVSDLFELKRIGAPFARAARLAVVLVQPA